MCGIAAVVNQSGIRGGASAFALAELLQHRGDTPVQCTDYGWATLACSRLAIVDRSGGRQPFESSDGEVAVVFNGEIYNHHQLREDLESEGCEFCSDCDTEVLVHGYRRWGERLADRLEGMYAFVLIDRPAGKFVVGRDPFGIKPLYYAHQGRTCWSFASEIFPLKVAGLEDIRPFQMGTTTLNGQVVGVARSIDVYPEPMTESAALCALRAKISASVSRHLPSDLPAAIFCSGGIDSSIVLYEAARAGTTDIIAYSVGTPDGEDPKYARDISRVLDVPFRFIEIDPRAMVRTVPRAISVIESFEPNHIRAGTANLALAEAVHRDGIKVALLGEGADEIFGGYEEFPETLRRGGTIDDVEKLLNRFTRELHRTQLRRVDRTTMAFGVEGRVPFLDQALAEFVLKMPTQFKVAVRPDGRVVGKYALREAYRGILPDHIVDRRKVPLGEGAGIGDNRPVGPFHDAAEASIDDDTLSALRRNYPEFHLLNKEEAYYFTIFVARYGRLALATERPMTNILATT